MEIIPVIDLKGGVVVRARRGERAAYRPIETPLSPTSVAEDVVAGLLTLFPLRRLYVADLDAIGGGAGNRATLRRIEECFPELEMWLDDGAADEEAARELLETHPRASLVLGSESQRDAGLVAELAGEARVALSLDFRGDAFLGPAEILADEELWPRQLIVMTLARVGSDEGPDFSRLAEIAMRAGGRAVYLAGGVRHRADVEAGRRAGAAGALVASALHDGRLTRDDLAGIAGEER